MTSKTWIGTFGDGLWTTNANWSPVGPPTSVDDMTIAGSAKVVGQGDSASLAVVGTPGGSSTTLDGTFNTGSLIVGLSTSRLGFTRWFFWCFQPRD
jgi:hypothetical protein